MNLSEVVVRPEDGFEDLLRKIGIATIIGTIQSTLTSFQFIGEDWKRNCEEERLLGVSLTGIMDHPLLSGSTEDPLEVYLETLKQHAIEVNQIWAERLGIAPSAAITCVKPSGTVSELVGSSSGIHPRYSKYYIRSIRNDNKDPLTQFLKESGVPSEPAFGKEENTTVFYFPFKTPSGSVLRAERTALQQLEHWLIFQLQWCEHKPSITVYVRESEWLEVGAWVFKHFDEISGVSFLPYSDHTYVQAPYQEVTEKEYNEFLERMPTEVSFDNFPKEEDDNSTFTPACEGDKCVLN